MHADSRRSTTPRWNHRWTRMDTDRASPNRAAGEFFGRSQFPTVLRCTPVSLAAAAMVEPAEIRARAFCWIAVRGTIGDMRNLLIPDKHGVGLESEIGLGKLLKGKGRLRLESCDCFTG